MVTFRALLEGQPDVQAEALLAPRALLGRAHDAIAAAGDDHVPLLAHPAGKMDGGLELGSLGTRARAAEDGHLAEFCVLREQTRGVTQLLERTVVHLQVRHAHAVLGHAQHRADHFLDQLGRMIVAPAFDEFLDLLIDALVAGRRLHDFYWRCRVGFGGVVFAGLHPRTLRGNRPGTQLSLAPGLAVAPAGGPA